jgi:hypothetical protein
MPIALEDIFLPSRLPETSTGPLKGNFGTTKLFADHVSRHSLGSLAGSIWQHLYVERVQSSPDWCGIRWSALGLQINTHFQLIRL